MKGVILIWKNLNMNVTYFLNFQGKQKRKKTEHLRRLKSHINFLCILYNKILKYKKK